MFVVTDENDIVQGVYFIPGVEVGWPLTWHRYFPVVATHTTTDIGSVFIPDKDNGSWLFVDEACTLLREKDRISKLKQQQRDH